MSDLTTTDCRFLAFHMITGAVMARASRPQAAIDLAAQACGNDASAIECLDCGEEGRKIWLTCQSSRMPIFLSAARKRHTTVYRGDFYASPDWYGSQKAAIPLVEG